MLRESNAMSVNRYQSITEISTIMSWEGGNGVSYAFSARFKVVEISYSDEISKNEKYRSGSPLTSIFLSIRWSHNCNL